MIAALMFAFLVAAAIIPYVHRLEFHGGDILIHGISPGRDTPQGFRYGVEKTEDGRVLHRVFCFRIGPFAWECIVPGSLKKHTDQPK
jgi:hypothetical protein